MTSSNGNIFRVTGLLWGNPPATDGTPPLPPHPAKGQWRGACFVWYAPEQTAEQNNRDAGDLRRHRAHYDVAVMKKQPCGRRSSVIYDLKYAPCFVAICSLWFTLLRSLIRRGYTLYTLIARFMRPTWGPSGADRTQVGPMLAPWTLLSGYLYIFLRVAIPGREPCFVYSLSLV